MPAFHQHTIAVHAHSSSPANGKKRNEERNSIGMKVRIVVWPPLTPSQTHTHTHCDPKQLFLKFDVYRMLLVPNRSWWMRHILIYVYIYIVIWWCGAHFTTWTMWLNVRALVDFHSHHRSIVHIIVYLLDLRSHAQSQRHATKLFSHIAQRPHTHTHSLFLSRATFLAIDCQG